MSTIIRIILLIHSSLHPSSHMVFLHFLLTDQTSNKKTVNLFKGRKECDYLHKYFTPPFISIPFLNGYTAVS